MSQSQAPTLTRRHLLILAGAGACACAGLSTSSAVAAEKTGTFDAGPLSDFGDGIADTFANNDPKIFVVRDGGKLFVSQSECTHKRCILKRTGAGYSCKCHKSKFDVAGVPKAGPAKTPLPRYAVSLDDRKHVIVDLGKTFNEEQWDDAAAFIKV
jgi:Rieske Fe-S protein